MKIDREHRNRQMLRIRDAIDREFATQLDIAALAQRAALSSDQLIRSFRQTFGETPHRYLQRRRLERAMALLRTTDLPVTDICLQVGYTSLGQFSDRFARTLGCSPSEYRARSPRTDGVPTAFLMAWTRPSTHVTER